MNRLTRTSAADLEIRGDGRTIVGIACPFGVPAQIGSFRESFRRGAFARSISERGNKIKLLGLHDSGAYPIGRSTLLREDTAGLYLEARVSQTIAGDEVLALIRDGALDSLSIGFQPIRDEWSADRTTVVRSEVKLIEISVVTFPAYETAKITAVRGDNTPQQTALSDPRAWLATLL
jgi:uncharacterized protein